jgi:hypothetical protein
MPQFTCSKHMNIHAVSKVETKCSITERLRCVSYKPLLY